MPVHSQVQALQANYVWVKLIYGPDEGFYVIEWPGGERERFHGDVIDAGGLLAPAGRSRLARPTATRSPQPGRAELVGARPPGECA